MATKISGWLLAFCLALIGWLYWDVSPEPIDYEWNSFLVVNSSTGQKRTPIEAIDLDKVIRPTDEYVNQTNSIERLFILAQQINYANVFSNYQIYLNKQQLEQSGWPVANQSACARELAWIQQQLAAHRHYALLDGRLGQELTRFVDSFGKPEAGLYSGSLTWPGQYDTCKRMTLDAGRIRTRYCLAMMRLRSWPAHEPGIPKTRIKVGICIPETCDTLSFGAQRDTLDALIKLDLNEFLRENLVLDSMFCLPDERSPVRQLPTGGLIFIYTLVVWLAIVICASIARALLAESGPSRTSETALMPNTKEQMAANTSLLRSGLVKPTQVAQSTGGDQPLVAAYSQSLAMRIVSALSIQQSWVSFKADPFAGIRVQAAREGRKIRVDFGQANFFKFLMAVVIVLGHSYLTVSLFANSFSHRIELNLGKLYYVGVNVHKLVDTFFLLFGTLAAYTLLRKFSAKQISSPAMWIAVNIGILSRIAPLYCLVYWYSKSVEPYTGDGPWWDYGLNKYTIRGMCMDSPWWRAIPYLSQRRSRPNLGCVQVGWFIVSLLQISLIMPLLIYLLYKLPRHLYRYLLLAFITIISCLEVTIKMRQLGSILRDTAYGTYGVFLIHVLELFQDNGVMTPLAKINGVACGCYTGYLLYQYEIGAITEWPRWLTRKLSLALVVGAHVLIMFMPTIGFAYTESIGHTVNSYDAYFGHVFAMIVWPVINSLLAIQLIAIYHRTRVCRALGHSFWHTANKIGFSIYLIHWNVLIYFTTSYQMGPYESHLTDIFKLTSLALIVSILLALLITILIEIPLSSLLALPLSQIQLRTNRVVVNQFWVAPKSKEQHKTPLTPELNNC